MKKIAVISIILVLLSSSCKTKKRTTYSKNLKTKNVIASKKGGNKIYNTSDDKSLPVDNGKFVQFKIASIEEYIETFAEIAQFEMMVYGIPASITLAQGLLESGFGKGELAMKTNNHFGIKCHKGWNGDFDFHDDDEKGECFRKYNHPRYSYRDHSKFLTTRSRYAFLFDYNPNNYKKWAHGLRKAGYATDKRYPQKLIYLIEKHKLYRFDSKYQKTVVDSDDVVISEASKIHLVKKGETLYAISRKYNVSVNQIMQLNKMKNTNLAIGQKLLVK